MNTYAIELENLPDFAQVELWDFYQFLLQKYQAKTVQEETQYLTRSPANAADLQDAVREIAERRNLIERELIEA